MNVKKLPPILSIKATISHAWLKANNSKATLWGGLGLIWIIGFAIILPFLFYYAFLMYKALVANDIATVISLEKKQQLISLLHFVIDLILFSSYIRIGIFIGSDLPYSLSQLFNKLISFSFLKIIFVYFLEFSLFFIFFSICVSFKWHEPFSYLFLLIGFCLYYISARCYLMLPAMYILNKGVWESCKLSFMLTQKNGFKIMMLKLIAFSMFIIAFLLLLLGLIWIVPLIFVLRGSVWKQLYSIDA